MINIAKPVIGEEEKKAILDVLDSGMIATGSVTKAFEAEFAAFIGTDYCITTTSGTTALETALRALGIGPGDTVLTTPFSFIASTNSILYTGATPVFADIDPRTFNIDPIQIEAALKEHPEVKALLIVHLFGLSCDMDAIMTIVKKHHLLLVEDCAQSHGAAWNGKNVGTFGDASCFSFYPTKNMTTGEGGAVMTSNEAIAKKARLLVNHGMEIRYHHDMIGYNYRMTNMNASLGRCQLKKLPMFNEKRIANAAYLSSHIQNPLITTPYVPEKARHVFHQYTVLVEEGLRDTFTDYLHQNEIGFGIFYPLTIPEQKCYEGKGFPQHWAVSDKIKREVVSLPVHPSLSEADLSEICCVINAFKGK